MGKKRQAKKIRINDFRTHDYRVFYASSYFNIDLWYEIEWNKKHIRKLHKHAKKPHLFHSQFTDGDVDHHRERHFREQVVDSIPFHKKIMEEHKKRLKTILKLMPKRKYKRIVSISMKHRGTPKYFVYDKKEKNYFFVAERLTKERRYWIHLVRDKYKLCDVVLMN